ncbi:hypothetical protein COLO4_24056 [Corchorus olitorius]|uniref:Transmembrane protein n=1 Tax=Corchorus olitorius TaxID=93759 RepID=A0A1R3ID45_9ROSI|nr:hypothetical protein COLO4_24056 [Corchorus olitorius]
MVCPAIPFKKGDIKDLIPLVFSFLGMSACFGVFLEEMTCVRHRENNEYSFIPLTFLLILLGVSLYVSMLSSVVLVIYICKSRPAKLKYTRGSVWFSVLASGFFFSITVICWWQLKYGLEKLVKDESNKPHYPHILPYSWGMMTSLALLAVIAIECWCQLNFELEKAITSGSTISMLSGMGYSIPYCLGVTSCLILACILIAEKLVANEDSSMVEDEDGLAAQDLEV